MFALLLGTSLVALVVIRLVSNYLRLRSIPGPFLAKFTDLWRSRAQNSRGFGDRMVHLHSKYGPLVRTGPNFISVSDPSAIPTIYGNKPVWRKASSYDAAILVSNGKAAPSVITMSEEKHTAVRRVAGRAFTTGELLDYEKFIDETASQLISIMRDKKCLDATLWFQCFATEVVNRVAFTDKMGFLDQGGDVEGLIAVAEQRFDYWNKWAALPGLEWLLAKSPIAQLRRRPDSVLALVSWKKMMSRGKEKREQSMKEGSIDLLQKLLDGQAKHPGRLSDNDILGVVMSIMSAGADTTATTFVAILFHLMKYPKVLAKLRAELDQGVTGGSISNPPSWKEVYQLPYLEAVVKETMRYWPPFAFGIDRIVPDPGAMIAGTMIPPGAEIGSQVESVHRDYSVYGPDADEYRPERWIEASEGQHALMEKSFLGFSTGKRVCLGMHIAIMELKKVIPLILMNFDISLAQDQSPLDNIRISGVKYPGSMFMRFSDRQPSPL